MEEREPNESGLTQPLANSQPTPEQGHVIHQTCKRYGKDIEVISMEGQRIIALDDLARQFVRHQEKVSRSRGRVLKLRDRHIDMLTRFRHHQRFAEESQLAFMSGIDEVSSEQDSASVKAKLHDLYAAMHRDQETLEQSSESLHSIQDRLGGLEDVLAKRELKLRSILEEILTIISIDGSFKTTEETDAKSETSGYSLQTDPSSEESVPPALEDYWDKKGNVKLMRKRIMEISIERRDALVRRNLFEDQGKRQELSDGEFNDYWQSELDSAQKELQQAIDAFKKVEEFCIGEGHVARTREWVSYEPELSGNTKTIMGVVFGSNDSLITMSSLAIAADFADADECHSEVEQIDDPVMGRPLTPLPNESSIYYSPLCSPYKGCSPKQQPEKMELSRGLVEDWLRGEQSPLSPGLLSLESPVLQYTELEELQDHVSQHETDL